MDDRIVPFFDTRTESDAARGSASHVNDPWELRAAQPFTKPPKPAALPAEPGG